MTSVISKQQRVFPCIFECINIWRKVIRLEWYYFVTIVAFFFNMYDLYTTSCCLLYRFYSGRQKRAQKEHHMLFVYACFEQYLSLRGRRKTPKRTGWDAGRLFFFFVFTPFVYFQKICRYPSQKHSEVKKIKKKERRNKRT